MALMLMTADDAVETMNEWLRANALVAMLLKLSVAEYRKSVMRYRKDLSKEDYVNLQRLRRRMQGRRIAKDRSKRRKTEAERVTKDNERLLKEQRTLKRENAALRERVRRVQEAQTKKE
tara:strand:+ start:83 stop:439 length:357 start_codon:yes stop_codon:yes gene_type:complete